MSQSRDRKNGIQQYQNLLSQISWHNRSSNVGLAPSLFGLTENTEKIKMLAQAVSGIKNSPDTTLKHSESQGDFF